MTAEHIEQSLRAIPNAKPQLEKFQDFMNTKKIKTLIIKKSEMDPTHKDSDKIFEDVLEYLEGADFWEKDSYTDEEHESLLGFTHPLFSHVVIKAHKSLHFNRLGYATIGKELADSVETAIKNRDKKGRPLVWTIAEESSQEAQKIADWVHEIGHQIHYSAGVPEFPTGKRLTEYSEENEKEYHAEHFAAWLFNREAFERFDREASQYFDDLMDRAIRNL